MSLEDDDVFGRCRGEVTLHGTRSGPVAFPSLLLDLHENLTSRSRIREACCIAATCPGLRSLVARVNPGELDGVRRIAGLQEMSEQSALEYRIAGAPARDRRVPDASMGLDGRRDIGGRRGGRRDFTRKREP